MTRMDEPLEAREERLLRERFGFAGFRPGQREVLRALAQQGAALGVFPTGAGKSLCYQLPALLYEGVTLVVSPLIALMKDQIDFLEQRGVAACRLDSTLSAAEAEAVATRVRAGQVKLLYVAPERFNNERFLGLLARTRIALFAVDEAHCISEWGHNFRPDYLKIAEISRQLGAERVLGLTATATPQVSRDICAAFGIPPACAIVTGFHRPNLTLLTTPVTVGEREARLRARLLERPPGPTIVYVTLQKTAEQVAALLGEAGLPARAYHAGLEAEARTAVQEWWMGAEAGIVVATIAFGMGIDKASVRYVYHHNLPKSLESYSQEMGRAGRDGLPATVELFACPDDVPLLESFAQGDTPTRGAIDGLLAELLAPTAGDDLLLNLYELSVRHDIRPLVLRTALTYLELLGVLRQGTPHYAAYEIKPTRPLPEIGAALQAASRDPAAAAERADFITRLFAQAKKGRIWYALQPDAAAEALREPRARIVRAVEYLQEQGWAEVRASDVRHRYRRLRPREDAAALADDLTRRFESRERQEIARLAQVLALVTSPGCQVNALVAHFGEVRTQPCGHCTRCLTGASPPLPPALEPPALPAGLDVPALRALRDQHPAALAHPRQTARFLCGLTSPATSRARLTHHPLFGALEGRRFDKVLSWCEQP